MYRSVPYTSPPDGEDLDEEPFVSRTLYFCRLPPDFTEDMIFDACARFGEVRKVTCYQSRQIAFAEYWDIRDAQKARHGLKTLRLNGRLVEVQYSKTQNEKAREKNTGTLYVRPMTLERHFHDPNTLLQYRELFGKFGDVKKVNTNRKREAEKFIEFHDLRHAERALEALNGFVFNGVKLEVQFANQSSKTVSASALAPVNGKGPFGGGSSAGAAGTKREPSPSQIFANNGRITTTPSNWGVPAVHASWRGVQGPAVVLAMYDRP